MRHYEAEERWADMLFGFAVELLDVSSRFGFFRVVLFAVSYCIGGVLRER